MWVMWLQQICQHEVFPTCNFFFLKSVFIPSLELLQGTGEIFFFFKECFYSQPDKILFCFSPPLAVTPSSVFFPFCHLAVCAAPPLSLLRFHWTERQPGEPAGHKNHSRDQLKENNPGKNKIIPNLQNPTSPSSTFPFPPPLRRQFFWCFF